MTIATSQPETNNSASGKKNVTTDFPITAPAANPVFYRTYSRKLPTGRESWEQVNKRNLDGLKKLGGLNQVEIKWIDLVNSSDIVNKTISEWSTYNLGLDIGNDLFCLILID